MLDCCSNVFVTKKISHKQILVILTKCTIVNGFENNFNLKTTTECVLQNKVQC